MSYSTYPSINGADIKVASLGFDVVEVTTDITITKAGCYRPVVGALVLTLDPVANFQVGEQVHLFCDYTINDNVDIIPAVGEKINRNTDDTLKYDGDYIILIAGSIGWSATTNQA